MRDYTDEELLLIGVLHVAWLRGEAFGKRANLSNTNLSCTNFYHANLSCANPSHANLSYTDLSYVNFSNADLQGADLQNADLRGANFYNANLDETCLSPDAPVPSLTDAAITAAGLTVDGLYIIGWRTARSRHCGSTKYEPGTCHVALYFSVDTATPCHPGIYFASLEWLGVEYGNTPVVVCVAPCDRRLCTRATNGELNGCGSRMRTALGQR